MSRFVAALVYRKRVGSMARKAILAYCGERANDDGSGVWASKVRIAKEVECSKPTVISTLNDLVSEGIMIEVGKRKTPHGYTVEYAVNVASVMALPDAFDDQFSTDDVRGQNFDRSTEFTPRGKATLPQEVKPVYPNRPVTVLKPSNACEDDLFSASEPTIENGDGLLEQKPDSDFGRFWSVYPKKAAKKDAQKAWAKAIKRETPERIIKAAEKYAAWLSTPCRPGEFKPHPKNAQGWLNGDRWQEFLDTAAPETFHEDALSPSRQSMLQDGICPPSMKGPDGTPNAEAAHWLKRYGHGVPA